MKIKILRCVIPLSNCRSVSSVFGSVISSSFDPESLSQATLRWLSHVGIFVGVAGEGFIENCEYEFIMMHIK